jgi:hypothetical protein
MARPKNRYARAQARARYRKPKRGRSSLGWNVAIGVIVVAGVGGIALSRTGSDDPRPRANADHWHARLAVNVCGQWLSNAPEFEARADNPGITAGIHTHGDGFMHIHPFASDEAGDNATIGTFLGFGGWDAADDSFELWEGGKQEDGGPCTAADGTEQEGTVRWSVNGRERKGDPSDYRPEDGDVIVFAFLPAGDEIPAPPEAAQANDAVPSQ